MDKKEIQEQRMKGYFIQATKEILKGEGLRAVSVRNIADKAGYSYATLYNYFKDVKDLIFVCVEDFQDECSQFIAEETKETQAGVHRIRSIVRSYIRYFVQYPGIFELFFLESISDIGSRRSNTELIVTFLDKLCEDEWKHCIEHNVFRVEDAAIMRDQLRYTVAGLLLLYLNRRHPGSYRELMDTIDAQLDRIFDL
jgi:AcrR family transcriptional regulator